MTALIVSEKGRDYTYPKDKYRIFFIFYVGGGGGRAVTGRRFHQEFLCHKVFDTDTDSVPLIIMSVIINIFHLSNFTPVKLT